MSYLLARCTQASGDYVEQLTYLLFLKMADERTKAPYLLARSAQASNQKSPVPEKYSWPGALDHKYRLGFSYQNGTYESPLAVTIQGI
jgi:hypothetical protein